MDHLPIIQSRSFTSSARAVWTQSILLAETLRERSSLARKHFLILDEKITIIDHNHFAETFDIANTLFLEARARELQSSHRPSEEYCWPGQVVDSYVKDHGVGKD